MSVRSSVATIPLYTAALVKSGRASSTACQYRLSGLYFLLAASEISSDIMVEYFALGGAGAGSYIDELTDLGRCSKMTICWLNVSKPWARISTAAAMHATCLNLSL
jgi:hypothetical protein